MGRGTKATQEQRIKSRTAHRKAKFAERTRGSGVIPDNPSINRDLRQIAKKRAARKIEKSSPRKFFYLAFPRNLNPHPPAVREMAAKRAARSVRVEGPSCAHIAALPGLSEAEGPALSEVEGPALSEVEGPALSEVDGSTQHTAAKRTHANPPKSPTAAQERCF